MDQDERVAVPAGVSARLVSAGLFAATAQRNHHQRQKTVALKNSIAVIGLSAMRRSEEHCMELRMQRSQCIAVDTGWGREKQQWRGG